MSSTSRPESPDPATAPQPVSLSLAAARLRGRRIAFVLYLLVAGAIAAAGSIQVFLQAFQRHEAPELGIASCADGLARLTAAIERARKAGSSTDGEDAALASFRGGLRPEWDDRDHIEDLCRPSPSSMAALDAIERLRYAEEHAVRREASELAPLRRRVQAIGPRDPGPPGASPSSAPSSAGGAQDPRNP